MRHRPGATSDLEQRLWLALLLAGGSFLAVVLLKMLLPWLLLAGVIGLGFWLWHRQQQREKALHLLFYDLLQNRGGRISALDFAMAAKLTGPEARAFLDARAKEFYANFHPTDQGDILYTFVTCQSTSPELPTDPDADLS